MLRFQCSLHLLQPSIAKKNHNHSNICSYNLAPFRVTGTKIQEIRTIWPRKSGKLRVNGIGREMKEGGEEFEEEDGDDEEVEDELSSRKRGIYGAKKEKIDYDKDPEFADILGDCLDNPEKAQKKVKFYTLICGSYHFAC